MEKELEKKEQSHDVSIAIIQNDIGHIRTSISDIKTTLGVFDKIFARKDELKDIERNVEDIHKEIKAELSKKVDHSDFDPIKKTLTQINWLLISAVVVALLSALI